MRSHQEDLYPLLSLEDMVLKTPTGSSYAPPGYLTDDESHKRRAHSDLSDFRSVVQDCLEYDPKPFGRNTKPKASKNSNLNNIENFLGLWFLGQYVLELALAEFFLQRYLRESTGPMRERVFALIGKRYLPQWIKAVRLQNLVFPYDDMDKLIRKDREPLVKDQLLSLQRIMIGFQTFVSFNCPQ